MPNNFLWPPDLAPAAVQAPCRPRGGAALTLLPTTASTNDRAARERGAGLVVADSQAAGRGRRGRSWQSPAGANLYWSARLPAGGWAGDPGWLPLLAGLALAQALERAGVRGLALKWPNDVLDEQRRKLAGVLVEGRASAWVVGIGVNVNLAPITGSVSLRELGYPEVGRGRLAGRIYSELDRLLAISPDADGEPHRSAWEARGIRGEVSVHPAQGEVWAGKVLGLAPDGRLRVDHGEREHWLAGEECSLRAEKGA